LGRINELSVAARSLEEPFREDEDLFLNCFENEPSLIRSRQLTEFVLLFSTE
jgi:hypothetical protein